MARNLCLTVLVLANLLPLWPIAVGKAEAGDLFVLYWLENLIIGGFTIVRIRTSLAPSDVDSDRRIIRAAGVDLTSARSVTLFFLRHYGVFLGVQALFTALVAVASGVGQPSWYWLAGLGALLVNQGIWLGVTWFGRGERERVRPAQAATTPYSRAFLLTVALLVVFAVIVVTGSVDALLAATVLCVLKTVLDAALLRFGSPRIELS